MLKTRGERDSGREVIRDEHKQSGMRGKAILAGPITGVSGASSAARQEDVLGRRL